MGTRRIGYQTEWARKNPERVKLYKQHTRTTLIARIGIDAYRERVRIANRRRPQKVFDCENCPEKVLSRHKRKFCNKCRYTSLRGNQFYKNVKNYQRGKRHHNWKGGRSGLRKQIRDCARYRRWRTAIFERDNYTCVLCSARNGDGKFVRLEADNFPQSFASILDQFSITTLFRARMCPQLWDISNGRTLCVDCHNKTKNGNPKHRKDD